MKSIRLVLLSLVVLAAATPLGLFADNASTPPPISMAELRSGGREVIRGWVAACSEGEATESRRGVREFDAALNLAAMIYNESGGAVILDVLAEAEDLIRAARRSATSLNQRARMAAKLGTAYERLAEDRVQAHRWYRIALRANWRDEVARAGMKRLERAEAIDLRKQMEAERARELNGIFRAMAPEFSYPETDEQSTPQS